MLHEGYQEYIDYLRESINSLVNYKTSMGELSDELLQVQDELFDVDPFILFEATLVATGLLAEQITYH